MSRVGCTVWRWLNGHDIVLVCSWACSVENLLPNGKQLVCSVDVSAVWCCGEASGQLWLMVYLLMHGWAWPEGHGEPQQLVVGVVAGWGLLAVCPGERWCARSMRHCGQAVRRRVSCWVVVFLIFLLDVLWTVTPFRMNCLSFKPSQAKVLTGGGDLHKAQLDVPLSASHSCVWPHSWAQ